MDIGAFQYALVAKSILWLVAGPVNGYISVYIYWLASVMSRTQY